MDIVTIENQYIRFSCSLFGGYMTSIFDKRTNEERQYQPRDDSWKGQDVVIFPFVARLIDQNYIVDDKTYSLRNHGLCRYNNFVLKEKSDDKIVLSFKSNEETLKEYPFDFEILVTYLLSETTIKISYQVINTGNNTMYFGLGAHPAMKVKVKETKEESIFEEVKVIFDKELDLTQMTLTDDGSFITGEKKYQKLEELNITKELFQKEKTLMLKAKDIKHVVLKDKTNREIHYDFKDINYLAIWSHPHFGDYVCIEPWMSLPDFVNSSKELKEKPTLLSLDKNKDYIFEYSISL